MNTEFNHIEYKYLVGYYGFACRVIQAGDTLSYVVVSYGYRVVPTMDIVGTREEAIAEYARRRPAKRKQAP